MSSFSMNTESDTTATCYKLETPPRVNRPKPTSPPPVRRATSSTGRRTIFGPAQTTLLKTIFAITKSPEWRDRAAIATRLGVTERVVQVWFQNERQRVTNAAFKSRSSHHSLDEIAAASFLCAMSKVDRARV